jgi:trimeric autotransporter adhesin
MNKFLISLFYILTSAFNVSLHAQNWQSLGTGTDADPHIIYADTFDNYLYVGGYIHQAGGVSVQGIARWNGTTWASMGNGANGDPYAIIRHDSELYVAGNFAMNILGGGHAHSIAKWNGISWDTLPVRPFVDTQVGIIFSMVFINNELYIGGIFNSVAGIPVNNLAKWNGNNWLSVDFPFWDGSIDAMCEYKGELYVGGQFYSSLYPNDTIQNIIRYDGSNWKSVGGGMHGGMDEVVSTVVYNNDLYVAGNFSSAHGNPGNYIAKWDGSNWSDVGGGVIGVGGGNGQIFQIYVHNNELYAVGFFSYAGGVPAQYIAKWNGSEWCGLGSYFDNAILCTTFYKDTLYVGGGFWTIDGDSMNYIAKWTGGNYVDTCGNSSGIEELTESQNEMLVFPNPFSISTTLQLSNPLQNASLTIYDIFGNEVKRLQNINGRELQLTREGLRSGMYFYNLIDEKGVVGKGKMIVE